jgi:hypothetical protein
MRGSGRLRRELKHGFRAQGTGQEIESPGKSAHDGSMPAARAERMPTARKTLAPTVEQDLRSAQVPTWQAAVGLVP